MIEKLRLYAAHTQQPSRSRLRCALLLALCLTGCSDDTELELHPVDGVVLLGGQPIAEARVTFHPEFEAPQWNHLPLAYTDSAGRFRLTTNTPGDGAPLGDYGITVELRQQVMIGEELVREGRHLLPSRYRRPESSGLRYRVGAGNNAVPPLELKRQ